VSGEEGSLGEVRRALAGITRRLDALADALGVAATAQPGALLDEPTRARLATLESLLAVGREATVEAASRLAVDRAITHARADCAALLSVTPSGTLTATAQRGFRRALAARPGEGVVGRALETGEIVQAAPGLGGPDPLLDLHGIGAALVVPVLDPAGVPAAALLAGRRRPVPFEPDAVGALLLVADRVAGALRPGPEGADDAGPSTLFASLDLERTAGAVAAAARARLAAAAVAIVVPDGEGHVVAGGAGLPGDAGAPSRMPVLATVASTGRPWTAAPGEPADPGLARCLGAAPRVVLPLAVDGGLVALLAAGGDECRTTLAPAFAREAALALRNARLHGDALRALADARPASRPAPAAGPPPLGDMASLLAVVLGRLAAVRDRVADPAAARDLADAEEAAWRVAEAVRRVLGFTPGSDPHAAVPLDLGLLVREAARGAEELWAAEGGGPPLRLDLEPVPPVRGHPDELQQALHHFLKNAREATEGDAPIAIRLRWDGEAHVELAVVDRGCGMDEGVRARAGEPFFSTKGPGRLGVGLAVAQAVAARHRGELELESRPGHGTTVRLRLPTATGLRTGPHRGPRRRAARVLVVEDERPIRETLVQGLARDGYMVSGASDVSEAVAHLDRETVDVVVTDLVLPGGSGLELARAVRRTRPGTAVILVTGWPGQVNPDTLETHGIEAILEKSVGLDTLRAAVAALVERAAVRPE
jgi:signal transduction histidine kinase